MPGTLGTPVGASIVRARLAKMLGTLKLTRANPHRQMPATARGEKGETYQGRHARMVSPCSRVWRDVRICQHGQDGTELSPYPSDSLDICQVRGCMIKGKGIPLPAGAARQQGQGADVLGARESLCRHGQHGRRQRGQGDSVTNEPSMRSLRDHPIIGKQHRRDIKGGRRARARARGFVSP